LLGLQVPGIIDLRVEASLSDSLHWYNLERFSLESLGVLLSK
jgi:hypothetical protein